MTGYNSSPQQTRSTRLILASQSPQRRMLLTEAGYAFDVIAPQESAEGEPYPRESPTALVRRLAQNKAADVAGRVPTGIIVACDTVVECSGSILGKPESKKHAREMLKMLSGRLHHVYSGLCLRRRPDDQTLVQVDVTKLKMEVLSDLDLNAYLDSNAWQGKAGAFGYQDRVGWLRIVAGSESNVVGLPLELLASMLKQLGEPVKRNL
jgi:septum formation protein